MPADLLFDPAARTGAFADHFCRAIVVALGQDVFVVRVGEELVERDHHFGREHHADLPVLKPALGQSAVLPRHIQARVAKIVLDLESIPAFIGEPVTSGMPEHVRMHRKIETGRNAGTFDEALKTGPRHRCPSLADEHVGLSGASLNS
jgi:hypothetical protein